MPYTSGVFGGLVNSWNDAVAGTIIDPTDWNEMWSDIETAFNDVSKGAVFAKTDVASASTCDIGATSTMVVRITGTTGITSFGTGVSRMRLVYFSGALTITHNATSLILPGGANVTTAANTAGVFVSDASGNWRCVALNQVAVDAISGMGAGVITFLATPSSANLAAALTDETGSGAAVFATSPTLVTPALGTPSAVNLTNGTALPVSGITPSTTLAIGVGSVELGHASDTTLARSGAGDVTIEGNAVYRAGGTDVPVTDGGTGRSTGTTAYALVATGTTATGAQQTLANGATTEILVGGGAAALPVWTTATGSGAPVRATSPTLVTPVLGTPAAGSVLTNCTGLPISSGVSGLGSDVAAALATPTTATLRTAFGTRELLTGSTTFYVRTDGNNSNTGLTNSSGGAFLTMQGAYDAITARYDFAGKAVTVQIVDGTYSGTLAIASAWVGGGSITFQGNSGTPANVNWSTTGDTVSVSVVPPGSVVVKDCKLTSSAGSCVSVNLGGTISVSNLSLGAAATAHFYAVGQGSKITITSSYAYSGAATYHYLVQTGGNITGLSITATASGTLAFTYFTFVSIGSVLLAYGNTYTGGTITGTRYYGDYYSVIHTNGGGANYFPGNVAGSVTSATYL